jgi:uncharacterized protein YecE (DUF72 family)
LQLLEKAEIMKLWIGCSGFHYKHWIDIFYPKELPQRKWFDFYSEHFNTLELNVTFYRFPKLEFLESWYNRSPDNFCFSVKAPKAITHFKQFNDTERMVNDFYGTTREGLKEKLGCVLFQLPPRAKYTEERLEKILVNLDPSFTNVLEFRNESWWNQEVFSVLTRNNISFCGMSHPEFPEDVIHNISTIYYRFHGLHELYKSPYTTAELQTFANILLETKKTKAAYLYFNNDIAGNAIKNAKELNEIFAIKPE